MIRIYLLSLLLSGCIITGDNMPVVEPMPFGQEEALYVGCVRGVIRWQYELTGTWPQIDAVYLHCESMRRSFKQRERRTQDKRT